MPEFPWLPVGHELPDGTRTGGTRSAGEGYQVLRAQGGGGCVLLVEAGTDAAGVLNECLPERVAAVEFLGRELVAVCTAGDQAPLAVGAIPSRRNPLSSAEATALVRGLRKMEEGFPDALWSAAVFVFDCALCLPVEVGEEDRGALAVRLLTGGVDDPSLSVRQIRSFNPWLTEDEIRVFLDGLGVQGGGAGVEARPNRPKEAFRLPGREELEAFFRENVIEPSVERERYAALGVQPPNGVLLTGPPGTGKTFAVRALSEHLGWPVFDVNLGDVGSPYIHQTSKQLRELFRQAREKAPAIVVVEEVDALGGARQGDTQDYRVEELTELLKHLETAAANRILVLATTNRAETLDKALLRKGRFDHRLEVGFPSEAEVHTVLEALLAERPHAPGLHLGSVAGRLAGRPLSDTAWVVNEAARFAVRNGRDAVDGECLSHAASRLRDGSTGGEPDKPIGFRAAGRAPALSDR